MEDRTTNKNRIYGFLNAKNLSVPELGLAYITDKQYVFKEEDERGKKIAIHL